MSFVHWLFLFYTERLPSVSINANKVNDDDEYARTRNTDLADLTIRLHNSNRLQCLQTFCYK